MRGLGKSKRTDGSSSNTKQFGTKQEIRGDRCVLHTEKQGLPKNLGLERTKEKVGQRNESKATTYIHTYIHVLLSWFVLRQSVNCTARNRAEQLGEFITNSEGCARKQSWAIAT
jgi:hypothetical protein